MRISHIHQRKGVAAVLDHNFMPDHRAAIRRGGNQPALQLRHAHIHAHTLRASVRSKVELHTLHLSAAFNGKLRPVGQSAVMAVFGHTADAVSAHF